MLIEVNFLKKFATLIQAQRLSLPHPPVEENPTNATYQWGHGPTHGVKIWFDRLKNDSDMNFGSIFLDRTRKYKNKKPIKWWGRQKAAPLKFEQSSRKRHFRPFCELWRMLIVSSRWHHVQCGCRLCQQHGCRSTFGESGLNSGRIIRHFSRPDPFYALLLSSVQLHFAADRNQLAKSYTADLWGQLSLTSVWNLVILT